MCLGVLLFWCTKYGFWYSKLRRKAGKNLLEQRISCISLAKAYTCTFVCIFIGVQEDEIVAIATQRRFTSSVDLEELLSTLETVADIEHIALRDIYETDAYARFSERYAKVVKNTNLSLCKHAYAICSDLF